MLHERKLTMHLGLSWWRVAPLLLLEVCVAQPNTYAECVPGEIRNCARRWFFQQCSADGHWGGCRVEPCPPGSTRVLGRDQSECNYSSEQDGVAVEICTPEHTWSDPICFTQTRDVERYTECNCDLTCCNADGACMPGNSREACAPSGQPCARCGDGEECVAGRCVLPPSEGAQVLVLAASVPDVDPSGRGCPTWDCAGVATNPLALPDLYVRERSRRLRSITVANTLTARWDEVVGVDLVATTEPLVFEVVDDDLREFSEDDVIASFTVPASRGMFHLTAEVGQRPATLDVEIR